MSKIKFPTVSEVIAHIFNNYREYHGQELFNVLVDILMHRYQFTEIDAIELAERIENRVKIRLLNNPSSPMKVVDGVLLISEDYERKEIFKKTLSRLDPFLFQKLAAIHVCKSLQAKLIEFGIHRDEGKDVVVSIQDLIIIAQVRHHKNRPVSKGEIEEWLLKVDQKFPGAAKVFVGICFTKDARRFAKSKKLRLIDFNDLFNTVNYIWGLDYFLKSPKQIIEEEFSKLKGDISNSLKE